MRDTIIIFYISTKFINIFVFMLVVAPGIESAPADICLFLSIFKWKLKTFSASQVVLWLLMIITFMFMIENIQIIGHIYIDYLSCF